VPNHKIHCYVDRLLFGKSYWRLHKQLDKPALLLGKRHRVLFHDGLTSMVIALELYPNDRRAMEAALVHIQLDKLCSSNPFFAKQLGYFAEKDSRRGRKLRNVKIKSLKVMPKGPFGDFNAFLMKLENIRRLARIMLG
jgi:hypothetical protein